MLGPSWSSSLTISSTLLSIQSLMDSEPYHNEPGYEKGNSRGRDVQNDVGDYNELITHETLRIAVIEMLQDNSQDAYGMPAALKEIMRIYFKTNHEFYEKLIQTKQKYDGKLIRDPHHGRRPEKFMYKNMVEKIIKLKEKLSQREDISIPIYKKITTKTLMASYRDVEKSASCLSDVIDDCAYYSADDGDDEGDNLLYVSDDEDGEPQSTAISEA